MQDIVLDNFLKLWIKSKIFKFYRQDPYLKYLETDIALSHLSESLVNAKTLKGLLGHLESSDYGGGLKISRKGDGKNLFEYPSISFQVESLLRLWPKICALYGSNQLNGHKNRFGHRPNLYSDFSSLNDESTIREKDIRFNSELKIPFQEDYPAFKQAVIEHANEVLKSAKTDREYVLVIQSDIEKFFHKLKIDSVIAFLNSEYPDIASDAEALLQEIPKRFQFSSLPIGWYLSGIFADLVAVKFHQNFKERLPNRIARTLQNIDLATHISQIASSRELAEFTPDQLKGIVSTSKVKFRFAVNYVDDFIFLLEFKISDQFKDKRLVTIFERVVTDIVLDAAENLIRETFDNKLDLKLYRPGSDKSKHFIFNKSNIDTLGSNFFSIGNAALYDPEEPNLWTRLDEFLLPADNDLTLNERTQFFSHLANIRQKILEGERIEDSELEDIFQKILLKIQGPEAKYIASVLKILEALLISDFDTYIEFGKKALLEINQEFQKSSKPLDLWLRFFSSYFRIYSRLSFRSEFKFFDEFDQFATMWASNDTTSDNDNDLIKAVRTSFLIRKICVSAEGENWLVIMARKRKGHMKSGPLTAQFAAFSVTPNSSNIKVYINKSYDSFSVSSLCRRTHHYGKISPSSYLSLAKKIKSKCSKDASEYFVNSSLYSVLPRWSSEEIQIFLAELPAITSSQHTYILKKLISSAARFYKDIGETYVSRLEHAFQNLVESTDAHIKLLPKTLGASNYRGFVFYLMTLQSNSLQETQKAYLATISPIDHYRDFSFLFLPLAYRKTGIGFYEILKLIIDIAIKNFSRSTLKPIAEKILNRELKPYRQQKDAFAKFKADGVCEIDLNVLGSPYTDSDKALSLTLCPMSFNTEADFSRDHGLSFPSGLHEKLDLKIESAINEARKQRASALVFPELCLPRRYLFRYLERCAANDLLLIAGVEYTCDHANFCRNSTIISFPVNAQRSPYAKNYIAFEQDKHFPAAEEKHLLEHNNKFKYKPGKNLFVFKSKKYLNFSVLTCSDFLSIGLRFKLQNRIQTIFVPAQNPDTTSYNHIAESCIRDLHCFAVVCNNQQIGGSFVYAPFHDRNKRAVFRKDGASLPEFLTIKWEPHVVLASQNADSQEPFRPSLKEKTDWNAKLKDMKQTPPDWGY